MTAAAKYADCRRFLQGPARAVWYGYASVSRPRRTTVIQYRNMHDVRENITAVLLTMEGSPPAGFEPRSWTVEPGQCVEMDLGLWIDELGLREFSGQFLLIHSLDGKPSVYIPPAVTAHWRSDSRYCEAQYQVAGNLNTKKTIGRKSFFMFCPVACTADRTTKIVLFNQSTDPTYSDEIKLTLRLANDLGETVDTPVLSLPPFGAVALDVGAWFGPEGTALLERTAGEGSVTVAHVGHIVPSLFYTVDRSSGDIIAGQHTQPPAAVLAYRKLWWGRLRQLSPW